MELCFNDRADITQPLAYYNVDQYSYLPTDRDQWLAGGWLDWDYYMVGILVFKRDEAGVVKGLNWQWEENTDPSWFSRQVHDTTPEGATEAAE